MTSDYNDVVLSHAEIDAPAYRALGVGSRALLVEVLAEHDCGLVQMSVRDVMDRLGVGRGAAQRALRGLLDGGFITVERPSRPRLYRVVLHEN